MQVRDSSVVCGGEEDGEIIRGMHAAPLTLLTVLVNDKSLLHATIRDAQHGCYGTDLWVF